MTITANTVGNHTGCSKILGHIQTK